MSTRYGQRRTAANQPSPRQLSYLNDLATQAGYEGGTHGRPFRERFSLYESSPWGDRLRAEAVTRANVSAWIGILLGEINAAGQEATGGETSYPNAGPGTIQHD